MKVWIIYYGNDVIKVAATEEIANKLVDEYEATTPEPYDCYWFEEREVVEN